MRPAQKTSGCVLVSSFPLLSNLIPQMVYIEFKTMQTDQSQHDILQVSSMTNNRSGVREFVICYELSNEF